MKFLFFTTALIFAILVAFNQSYNSTVVADGGQNNECEDAPGKTEAGDEDELSFTAPEGNIVTGVCIKSGSNMFGDSHSEILDDGDYEDGCYTVSGVGTQEVTVERNFESNECQGLSHIDVYYSSEEEPTPTNTPTPTEEEPTPTETEPTPTETEETPTPTERHEEPTPTEGEEEPTPTEQQEQPTNTPTPTEKPGEAQGPTSTPAPEVGGITTPEQKQGEVLGAEALPVTGNINQVLTTLEQTFGAALASLSILLYGKKNRKKTK